MARFNDVDWLRKKLGEFSGMVLCLPQWVWCHECRLGWKGAQVGLYFTFASAVSSSGFLPHLIRLAHTKAYFMTFVFHFQALFFYIC